MTSVRFTGPVAGVGDRAIVWLPREASEALPSRGQVAATATIEGERFDTIIEPDGLRGHWMDVSAIRSDTVTVELELSSAWPEPSIPDDLVDALSASAEADSTWRDITAMARWEWVRWINATRSEDTRRRRVEVSIDKLVHGMRRPCCFNLSSCTDPELARSGKLSLDPPTEGVSGGAVRAASR